jgi:anti-sigma factor RsiW
MGISCQHVWRDISDYIDEDLNPIQRAALDQHFAECLHCSALLDSMRNVSESRGLRRIASFSEPHP